MRYLRRFIHRLHWTAWLVENRGMTWRQGWIVSGVYQKMTDAHARFGGDE